MIGQKIKIVGLSVNGKHTHSIMQMDGSTGSVMSKSHRIELNIDLLLPESNEVEIFWKTVIMCLNLGDMIELN